MSEPTMAETETMRTNDDETAGKEVTIRAD